MDQRTEIEDRLRAASDAIMLLVSQVSQLETHKRGVPPDHPRFDELARAVQLASRALADFADREEEWARGAAAAAGRGIEVIEATRPPATLQQLLEEWRAVERALENAEPGTPEAARLFEEFERARDAYVKAFEDLTGSST